MLVSKEVMVKWNPRTKKYYENLGYIYTKMNNYFEVKVNDLINGSHVYVDVKCDCCEKDININWQTYKKYVKDDNKYYCQECAMKLYGGENLRLSLLQNGMSFEQWCLENNRQDVLDRWDYELNDCLPSEISYGASSKKFYFKCPRGSHKSELKSINDFTNNHDKTIDCKVCNSFAQWGINNLGEDFLEKYWDYEKNTVDPWEFDRCASIYVWIKCQEKDYHGSSKMLIYAFSSMGVRCSYCGNFKVHEFDSLGYLYPEVLNIWSDKDKKSPYQYKPNSDEKVYWKCPNGLHEDYKRKICKSNLYEFRCPECSKEQAESSLQEKTRLYLIGLGFDILHENKCTLMPINIIEHKIMKRKGRLRYDNEIIINNKHLIIEVNGSQHYEVNSWHKKLAERYNTTPEYELAYQKTKDKYKKDYAINNSYLFLELPYWVFDKKETYKHMIDNMIISLKAIS